MLYSDFDNIRFILFYFAKKDRYKKKPQWNAENFYGLFSIFRECEQAGEQLKIKLQNFT